MLLNDSVMEAAAWFSDPSERAEFVAACCDFVFSGVEPEGKSPMVMSNFYSQRHALAVTRAKMLAGKAKAARKADAADPEPSPDAGEAGAEAEQGEAKTGAGANQNGIKTGADAKQSGIKTGANANQNASERESKRRSLDKDKDKDKDKVHPPSFAGGGARAAPDDPVRMLDRRGTRP